MTLRSTSAKIALIPLATLGALAVAGTSSPAGASTKTTTVKAVETEFKIALSTKSFSAGTYKFVTQNKGKVTHALEITGPGLHNAATPNIQPGKSANLTVTLKAGKYDIFCPVPGHKMLGMTVNVVVVGVSGHATSKTTGSKAPPTTSSGGAGF
jgi:uncharacterized cupredoxin-like copper-binding protein